MTQTISTTPSPMPRLQTVCVYCGASPGLSPIYGEAADALAAAMVERNIALVYGGAKIGLMGQIADGILRRGGEATGVMPKALMDLEVAHGGLTRLHVVKDMHERKAMMASLSDGFVAMPGGLGTLEELFEILTWAQLGFHAKPVGLLNAAGFYDGLLHFIGHQVTEGFVRQDHAALIHCDGDATALLHKMTQGGTAHGELDAARAKSLFP